MLVINHNNKYIYEKSTIKIEINNSIENHNKNVYPLLNIFKNESVFYFCYYCKTLNRNKLCGKHSTKKGTILGKP